MTDVTCPNCDGGLGERDLAKGWCERCGVRLPPALRTPSSRTLAPTRAIRSREFPRENDRATRVRPGLLWVSLGVIVGLAVAALVWLALR